MRHPSAPHVHEPRVRHRAWNRACPITLILRRLLAWSVALPIGLVVAAEAHVVVLPPADFGVKPRGTLESVAYAVSSGELPNLVDKANIEKLCESARLARLTDSHPIFEAGHDRPLATQTFRFLAARRRASYSVLHAYQCDGSPAATAVEQVCACTYRVRPHRSVQIERTDGGRHTSLSIDLTQRTASRVVTADHSLAQSDSVASGAALDVPQPVGRDEVAGMPCVVHRQRLGPDNWIDRCVVESAAGRPEPGPRARTLSEGSRSQGGRMLQSWSKVVQAIPDAWVDVAVFDLPEGVVAKDVAP
jgi:hypothetical protein